MLSDSDPLPASLIYNRTYNKMINRMQYNRTQYITVTKRNNKRGLIHFGHEPLEIENPSLQSTPAVTALLITKTPL